MSKQKFQEGDKVIIAPKFKERYNQLTKVGEVVSVMSVYDFPDPNNRKFYEVRFPDKKPIFGFYSYEIEKVTE